MEFSVRTFSANYMSFPTLVSVQPHVDRNLGCSEAVAFIEEILNESRNNPVHGRLTMKEYLKGMHGIEFSSAPHMTDQEVVDELLSGQRTDPHDQSPNPKLGTWRNSLMRN